MNSDDTELQLLETIYSAQNRDAQISQRDLAGATGLSLGMTNALLRRFVERGWVKLTHLSGRSLRYVLTAEGMEEVVRRSIKYFTRAAQSASLYRAQIEEYVRRLAKEGYDTLVLQGPEELDFLFRYSCERHGLSFVKNPTGKRREHLAGGEKVMFVLAETSAPDISRADVSAGDEDAAPDCKEPEIKASKIMLSEIVLARSSEQAVAENDAQSHDASGRIPR